MKKFGIILATLLVTACASTPATKTEPAAQTENEKAAATTPSTAQTTGAETEAVKLNDEMQNLQKQSVYFDFDKFTVKSEFRDTVEKQAAFIKSHSNDVVTLEGNADERGSSEYNLALGAKRANAVKTSLKVMGVAVSRIKETSYGEEKPRQTCHEESCWKENRRVDFVHNLN